MEQPATQTDHPTSGPSGILARDRMPVPLKAVFGYHVLLLVPLIIGFGLWSLLTVSIIAGSLSVPLTQLLITVLLGGGAALCLAALYGTWNRRRGAWFALALIQLAIIVVNLVAVPLQWPAPGTSPPLESLWGFFIAVASTLIAVAIVAYLLTRVPKYWFHIEEPE